MPYIGNTPADKFLTLAKQSFSTSATTSYTLDSAVSSTQDIALFINNVRQSPVDAYSVSGTALTLTSATAGTDEMYCVYLGKTVGTSIPASDSITTAMLNDDAVTTAKINDDAVNSAKLSSTAVDNTNTNSTLITSQTEKSTLVDADKFLLSDSAASGALKYVQKSNLPSGQFHVVRSAPFSNGDAYMEMTNAFNSTYNNYLVQLSEIQVNTDGADLEVKFGQSDGTYTSGFGWQGRQLAYNGNEHNYSGSNVSRFVPAWSLDSGAGNFYNFNIWVWNPMSATDGKTGYFSMGNAKRYDQGWGVAWQGGTKAEANATPRLHIDLNTGTFINGRVTVYGITNSGNV